MENLVIKGEITATSKKTTGDFKQEIPTKTAYVKVDEENAKKLEGFGLTRYTPKDGGEDYFIIKFPANLMVYLPNGSFSKRPDLSQVTVDDIETNNFKTPEGKSLSLNIIKGNHKNNDFFRLQSIRIESKSDIEEIKPENPFGDEETYNTDDTLGQKIY